MMNERRWPVLSEEEKARARRFRDPGDRDRWVYTHVILRRILGHLAGCDARQIAFAMDKGGKPKIVEPAPAANWHFSFSHSYRMALIGATRIGPLGVDIEHVRALDDMNAVADRVFARRERIDLMTLCGRKRLDGFFNGWTRKEALIKATGAGLSQPLKSIEVTLIPGAAAVVRSFADSDPAAWQLCSPDVAGGYVAALAIRSDGPIPVELLSHTAID